MSVDAREQKLTGGAWILEQFTLPDPAHERNAARRVLSEVMRAWPGDVHRLWWKWFSEASTSRGLRSKTLDCTVDEAVSLAANGAQLVVYREDPEPEWLAVLGTCGSRFQLAVVGETDKQFVHVSLVTGSGSSCSHGLWACRLSVSPTLW